jgi:exonuclease III
MKIATFNINNVKKRLDNLMRWLREARPDVVCLQELKATDPEFPVAAIDKVGYGAVWRGQKTWNGVAILGRDCEPVVTRSALPGDPNDTAMARSLGRLILSISLQAARNGRMPCLEPVPGDRGGRVAAFTFSWKTVNTARTVEAVSE